MRIGILGTGMVAAALGEGWVRAGHEVVVGGRSAVRAQDLAGRLGQGVRALPPREVVAGRDAVLLAVAWDGVEDILKEAGATDGLLKGMPLIDPTNAVEHGVGVLLTGPGDSVADRIARLAPGAHVVKAFHLFPAERWTMPPGEADPVTERSEGAIEHSTLVAPPTEEAPVTVAMCGDDPEALRVVGELVRDVGGIPAVLGPLDRVRQLEEVAGFVIGLAFSGVDPVSAVPHVPSQD